MRGGFGWGGEVRDESLEAREDFGEGLVAYFLATDANTLVDFLEMGRGIQAGSKAGVAKDGFEEGGGGAFAVGAGDVRAGIGAVGTAEALGKNGDVFEVELCGGGLRWRSEFATKREQVADRGLVIHFRSGANRASWR